MKLDPALCPCCDKPWPDWVTPEERAKFLAEYQAELDAGKTKIEIIAQRLLSMAQKGGVW